MSKNLRSVMANHGNNGESEIEQLSRKELLSVVSRKNEEPEEEEEIIVESMPLSRAQKFMQGLDEK